VQFVAADLEHAYRMKRATMRDNLAGDQIRLTKWCMRHRMLSHAARHLLHTMTLDPEHPEITGLEHRLRLSVEQQARNESGDPRRKATGETAAEETVAINLHPLSDVPAGTLEAFTQTVQPVLLNRCASAGCHGANSPSSFRLRRPAWGKTISRDTTLHNLRAAMALLDRESPRHSPLLTAPAGPHGPLDHGLFAPHEQGQLARLAHWADLAAVDGQVVQASALEQGPLLQQLPGAHATHRAPPAGGRQIAPSSAADPSHGPAGRHGPPRRLDTSGAAPLSAQDAPPHPAAGDPCDPAEFNRRHHGVSPARGDENSPR
jgi:hypothetical protein